MAFKRVVDFHGHLCPDLLLGAKLYEYVKKILLAGGALTGGISIIAENCTSALDAIQNLIGATLGNQRLQVLDFGKHNYTLRPGNSEKGFRFTLKKQHYDDENEYNELEQKIMNDQIIMDEVVQFQKILDDRVKHLIGLNPEEIFDVKCTDRLGKALKSL
jgi:formylmethanofuran dehydrogenase subunit E